LVTLAPSWVQIGVTDPEADELTDVVTVLELALAQEIVDAANTYGRRLLVDRPVVVIEEDPAARRGLPVFRARYEDPGENGVANPSPGAVGDREGGRRRQTEQSGVLADSWQRAGQAPGPADLGGSRTQEDDATTVLEDEEGPTAAQVQGDLASRVCDEETQQSPHLVLVLPDGGRVDVPISGRLLLGRGRDVDVEVLAPQVSRLHATVHATGSVAYVEDHGSANGTWLNRSRVEAVTEIRVGDEIAFGEHGPKIRLLAIP
jgi:hypothetical protein